MGAVSGLAVSVIAGPLLCVVAMAVVAIHLQRTYKLSTSGEDHDIFACKYNCVMLYRNVEAS